MVRQRSPRSLIHKLETSKFPLQELKAIHDLREYLDRYETDSLLKARKLGCSASDIAEALGITRQGVYHKLRQAELRREQRATENEAVVIPDLEADHNA